MINVSTAYRNSIIADVRRMYCRAIIEIIDPDIRYGSITSSGEETSVSRSEQLHDKDVDLTANYTTLEKNRWILNGKNKIIPTNPNELTGQSGFVSSNLSRDDCSFNPSAYVEMHFSNVSILQACSIYFTETDGHPVDFTVEVKSGGYVKYSKAFSANKDTAVYLDGFTVENPDAIRVTATKWSKPGYRMRVSEIIPGIYEKWSSDLMASFSVEMQCDPSCMTLPYGTASISVDNSSKRFNPRNKNGIFRSIEERQGLPLFLGTLLPDGSVEYKQLGVFYQYSGGWKTDGNNLTMSWNLADIVGLISERKYIVPDTLPTTLEGWVASIVALLGNNFVDRYYIEPEYSQLSVTALNREALADFDCGTVLRFACMVTGTVPRADQETGNLYVGGFSDIGGEIDLDNMKQYPVSFANENISSITFTLADGNVEEATTHIVPGNAPASSATEDISNPFIHTVAQAEFAASHILKAYSGTVYSIVSRGDPSKELGDIVKLTLDQYGGVRAQIVQQSFSFSSGVLQDCSSQLIEVPET